MTIKFSKHNGAFWLVTSWSRFYSTERYHGIGPPATLICRSLASGKFRLPVAKAGKLRRSKIFSFLFFFLKKPCSKRLIGKRNIQQMNFTTFSVILRLLKPGFHDRPDRPDRPSRLKRYSDDRDDHIETLPRRSQTTRTTETTSIAWIELSSIRTIGKIV